MVPPMKPSAAELQAYALGLSEPQRAEEIEAFLADGPDCTALLENAPQDALVRHLRGAGSLPPVAMPSPAPPPVCSGTAADACAAEELGGEAAALREHPRYQLLRKLGQGGMGTVYLAEHRLMHRRVAVKLLRAGCLSNPQLVARFHQEVEAVARLTHPHIVTAHDADEAGGTHFPVMEYVEGESLGRLVTRGPLPVHEACAYARRAALGLEFAHSRGMVHRDIKPQNLMVTYPASGACERPGETTPGRSHAPLAGVVKILDFGLARVLREATGSEDSLTSAGTVMGTADYIAPEQARDSRRADIRADIYSLGCTLYHLLSGQVPFPGGTAIDKILRHATERPRPLCRSDLPAGLAAVLDRMMAKRPEDRYQTPAE